MNFACTQENLLQGLSMVGHITGKNINLPILANVLLRTENGSLRLSATNLEIAITCMVRGKVETDGEYSVPAKLLQDYVALLPTGKVEIEVKEEGLEIRSNGQQTVIKGMAASEFPLLPKLANGSGYSLKAIELKRALSQVTFAASVSESRPELAGVACFFRQEQERTVVTFVTTDSYRLAERRVVYGSPDGAEGSMIVPARSMLEISRILSSYKDDLGGFEDIVWKHTENQLVVIMGTTELVSRLIEGSFPPYQEIIPTAFKTEALLPRIELQKAVRAASLFSRQGMFDIQLTFDPTAGTCAIQSADQGTGKTMMTVKGTMTGEPVSVMLNYKYVNDGLSALQTDIVKLALIDSGSPLLLLPEPKDEEYRYLVMPIRQ